MSTPPRRLFTSLIDDAAMFPPGNANAEDALAGHLRFRASWFADLVGPLLVPARAFADFAAAHQAADSPLVAIVVIGTTARPADVPTSVRMVGFEAPVADVPLPQIPAGASMAAEIAVGAAGGRVLAAVAEARANGVDVVGKFRTGGTTADAFPSEEVLAGVLCLANAVPVPLKLTAGLHHATRCTEATTGFEQHGFLNVLCGVAAALAGAAPQVVAEILTERDPDRIAGEVRRFDESRVATIRERFVSFGCCGVEDPIDDLVGLGLVTPEEIA